MKEKMFFMTKLARPTKGSLGSEAVLNSPLAIWSMMTLRSSETSLMGDKRRRTLSLLRASFFSVVLRMVKASPKIIATVLVSKSMRSTMKPTMA